MPNVKIELVGDDKENAPLLGVMIGDKSWGINWESWETAQYVPAGTAVITFIYTQNRTDNDTLEVADTEDMLTLRITINSDNDEFGIEAEFV